MTTDLSTEGRERLREAAWSLCSHSLFCGIHDAEGWCDCDFPASCRRYAIPDLLDALAAAEALVVAMVPFETALQTMGAERDALRAALQSAAAACPRRCNEGTFRYPTWQGWETRPCKVCGPWRKVLSEGGKL